MAGVREGGGGEGGRMKGGGGEGGVRVAVRVRPFNGRERQMESRLVVEMAGETQVKTELLNSRPSLPNWIEALTLCPSFR